MPSELPPEITAPLVLDASGVWIAQGAEPTFFPENAHEHLMELEESSFWFDHRNALITELVTRHVDSGVFYDVGGGNGVVARALQAAGVETCLVEPGEDGAYNARRRGIDTVVQGTLESLELRPGSVRAFGLFDVLEHVEGDAEMLGHLHERLMPGGHLFLTVPAYEWLWSDADVHTAHYRRYTTGRLRRDLEAAGFEVELTSYMFTFLVPPIFVFKTIPSAFTRDHAEHTIEEARREHGALPEPFAAVLDTILALERQLVLSGPGVPFGSSCIAVARKPG